MSHKKVKPNPESDKWTQMVCCKFISPGEHDQLCDRYAVRTTMGKIFKYCSQSLLFPPSLRPMYPRKELQETNSDEQPGRLFSEFHRTGLDAFNQELDRRLHVAVRNLSQRTYDELALVSTQLYHTFGDDPRDLGEKSFNIKRDLVATTIIAVLGEDCWLDSQPYCHLSWSTRIRLSLINYRNSRRGKTFDKEEIINHFPAEFLSQIYWARNILTRAEKLAPKWNVTAADLIQQARKPITCHGLEEFCDCHPRILHYWSAGCTDEDDPEDFMSQIKLT